MNKGQLIESIATDLDTSKAAAARIVESVIESITNGIRVDDSVTINGFGTFARKERAARIGRNPNTGEPLEIKASTTVSFKPSQSLKNLL